MSEYLFLKNTNSIVSGEVSISGSKSESNRLLILNTLYGNPLQLQNISNSEDTQLLQKALSTNSNKIDIHHAGTAMRFLTAYFSIQDGKTVTITGSSRMKQRPIGILVEALRTLGADIHYLEKEGFPPLQINGKNLTNDFVELEANISSQFISALILIAPKLSNGLTISLKGKVTSLPYLKMTLDLLKTFGVKIDFSGNKIKIYPKKHIETQTHIIESDWSSASYFYSIMALAKGGTIRLNSFFRNSLQGDSEIVSIYKNHFGVESEFYGNQIILKKNSKFKIQNLKLDLNATPDIAQTIAITCAGLQMKCELTGLETLKIKETDRLIALQNELKKIGTQTDISDNSLKINDFNPINEIPTICTYDDHRMAMSFAPLHLLFDLKIENPKVVNKSYSNFWEDFFSIFTS
ncbi:MAG: 3-phosphoshikimate 1-carboxyvinyltransferase [Moheibacter sp.]